MTKASLVTRFDILTTQERAHAASTPEPDVYHRALHILGQILSALTHTRRN